MSYGKLLLKSLKKYLGVSIGIIIGSLVYLRFISNITKFSRHLSFTRIFLKDYGSII